MYSDSLSAQAYLIFNVIMNLYTRMVWVGEGDAVAVADSGFTSEVFLLPTTSTGRYRTSDQSINQSINRSINRSIDRSINNRLMKKLRADKTQQ